VLGGVGLDRLSILGVAVGVCLHCSALPGGYLPCLLGSSVYVSVYMSFMATIWHCDEMILDFQYQQLTGQ